jgi:phosphoserine phosphatase
MTQEIKNPQIFSGLILLTCEDKAGLADSLFEALSPFAVSIIDIDQIIIKGRLFLTLQISLNPDHQEAIEEDMTQLAEQLQVDIACIFSTSEIPQDRENLVVVDRPLLGTNILNVEIPAVSVTIFSFKTACSFA